jgi:hypothetical protein
VATAAPIPAHGTRGSFDARETMDTTSAHRSGYAPEAAAVHANEASSGTIRQST